MNLQIKSLVVQECGPLHDMEISFTAPDGRPRPVTVIGGANGSGKTTILELIFALMQMLPPGYSTDAPNLPILNRTREAKLNLLVENENAQIRIARHKFSSSRSQTIPTPLGSLQQAIRNDNSAAFLPFEVYQSTKQPSPELPDESEVEQKKVLAPSVLYFPHYRRIVPVQGAELFREEITYQWTYRYETVRSFKGSLNAYLVWLEYAHPTNFEIVKRFLNKAVLTGKVISHIDRPNLQTIVELPGGVTHPLDELSSGEQNLLIIMLELWRRLLPGSIVLIDEIENSLHPAFQHRLAEALLKLQARIPFQLIVTTHAPAFLDAFGAYSTLILTEF